MNKRRVTPLINRIYLFWPLFKKIISRSDYDPLKAEWIITTQRSLLLNKHTLTHSCDSVPTSVRLLYFLFTHSCFPTFLLRIQSGTIWVFVSLWVKYVWKPLRVCVSRYGVTNLSNLSACCFVQPSYYLLIWAVFRPSVICPSLDYRTDKDRESFFFFFSKNGLRRCIESYHHAKLPTSPCSFVSRCVQSVRLAPTLHWAALLGPTSFSILLW